ncbi:MAG: hypothetical protein CM15mP109_05040 [Candidatus Dadabacteria bacterium]|nr:MAG: hypothetical protein CM15mP109_05040 [Candidatus Dadabacteria bacterium]
MEILLGQSPTGKHFIGLLKEKTFSDSGGFVADHDPSIDEDVFVSGRYIENLKT